MSIRTCQAAALPLLLFAQAGLGPPQRTTDPDALSLRISALAGEHLEEGDCRSLVVLAAVGDEVVFEGGWGMAAESGPGTRFRVGSLVEQMIVVRTLQLSYEGRLSLEDPVAKHLPEPTLGGEGEVVTVQDLLGHTSGLPDYVALDFNYEPGGEAALLARVAALPLETAPGVFCSYSRTNILALGLVIEQLDETPLGSALTSSILEPAELASTVSEHVVDSLGDRARQEVGRLVLRSDPGPQPFGAEFLVSDAGDLLRWQRGLVNGALLGGLEFVELTRTPPSESGEVCAPAFQAVTLGEYAGVTHGGGMEGDRLHLAYYPSLEFSVVVLARGSRLDAASVARAVVRAVYDLPAPELVDLPLSRTEARRYVGDYKIGSTSLQIIEWEERLALQSESHGRVALLHQGGRLFVAADGVDLRLTFQVENAERASGFDLEEHGSSSHAVRFD